MDGPTADQPVPSSKKRVRRNALKPNSAESDSLREFSIMHSLSSKIDLDGKDGTEEQKGDAEETTEESVSEKRQKVSLLGHVESASTFSSAIFPSVDCNEESESSHTEQLENAASELTKGDFDISKAEPNSDACSNEEEPMLKIP